MNATSELERDVTMELYCDVLVRCLLVESTLGECEILRNLEAVLESGDADRLATALRSFESLPEDLRARIMDGDPTLQTRMETLREREDDGHDELTPDVPRIGSASA